MKARVRKSGTYFYYFDGKKEIPLGTDHIAAITKWAELEKKDVHQAPLAAIKKITFRYCAEQYFASEKFKQKSPRTQKDYLYDAKKLYEFFDDPPVLADSITSPHIAMYRDWRKVTHSTQELALFSAIWFWAKERGYVTNENPATKVERNRGEGRSVSIDDALYGRVYEKADQPTRDAMDLAFLAAQRPGDSLRFKETDIHDGALHVRQNKTKMPVRIEIVGKLKEVIDRIMERKAQIDATPSKRNKVRSIALVVNEDGAALSQSALDNRFEDARRKAGIPLNDFHFRDLRAKAATEIDDTKGLEAAQRALGHTKSSTTQGYIRHRLGKLVKPTR